MFRSNFRTQLLILLILSFFGMTGCNGTENTPTIPPVPPTATEAQITPTSPPTLPEPTETELTKSADVVVLVNSDEQENVQAQYGEILSGWANANGFSLEYQPNLLASSIRENTRIVLLFNHPPNLNALLGNAPSVQFVDVNGVIPTEAANLIQMTSSTGLEDELTFTAGYLAAMLNYDYRIGYIGIQGETNAYAVGYRTGAEFFCGLCNSFYPPYVDYPVNSIMNSQTQSEAITALDALISESVRLVYLSPQITDPSVLTQVSISGLEIIASSAQAEHLGSNLLATIDLNSGGSLESILDGIIHPEQSVGDQSPILIQAVNEVIMSEGKLDLINSLLPDLLDGFYDTGIE